MSPTGYVIAEVFRDGVLMQRSENHNIITSQGDSYIADQLSLVPVRSKFGGVNAFIAVGTGWTGISPKTNTWVNTLVGIPTPVSAGYPQLQATWGNTGSNVLVTIGTYPVGALNATGITEAALVTTPSLGPTTSCFAYAQLIPPATVTSSDTFLLTWVITFLGS